MKHSTFALVGALMVAGALVGQVDLAYAQGGIRAGHNEQAHCKLTNTKGQKNLYDGECSVQQVANGQESMYTIKMGSREPVKFSTQDAGKTWTREHDSVDYSHQGHSATFSWGDFQLQVQRD